MKSEKINIRAEKKIKEGLEKLANDNKREFSDYIRLLYEYAIKHKIKF